LSDTDGDGSIRKVSYNGCGICMVKPSSSSDRSFIEASLSVEVHRVVALVPLTLALATVSMIANTAPSTLPEKRPTSALELMTEKAVISALRVSGSVMDCAGAADNVVNNADVHANKAVSVTVVISWNSANTTRVRCLREFELTKGLLDDVLLRARQRLSVTATAAEKS
jgi:hypothetical protein